MSLERSRTRRAPWVACFAATVALSSAPAGAQTAAPAAAHPALSKPLSQSLTGGAKADFEAAKLLASDGDFAGALVKFGSAYDASKDPRLLWNMAFCQKNLRHYSKVVTTLRRYVQEGGANLSANDKKEAQDLIATIEPFTTRATFHVSEDGAQIFVDDELVATSPATAPIDLDIGERRLHVVKEGFRAFDKALVVGGSAEGKVEVALEREVHEGKLLVDAPAGAAIFIDDKPAGSGRLEQSVPSGGHQLRVTAPGMRPFQTEIVVQDKETRSLNVVLEPESAADKPTLRVAVGCADSEPRAPEDGLVVYTDNLDVLSPSAVHKRWNEKLGKNVVQDVEYPVPSGRHPIRVRITDCDSRDTTVDVDATKGADLGGALESNRFILFRGPMGSPGLLRASLGGWMGGGDVRDSIPFDYSGQGVSAGGITGEVGIVTRWFGVHVSGSYGEGMFAAQSHNPRFAVPSSSHVTWSQLLLRLGLRVPLNLVALGLGPSIGLQELDVDQIRTGKPSGTVGGYFEVDVAPLCDWGLYALATASKPTNEDGAAGGAQLGVFFEPNSRCRAERGTRYGLR
jgi:PEGA domain